LRVESNEGEGGE